MCHRTTPSRARNLGLSSVDSVYFQSKIPKILPPRPHYLSHTLPPTKKHSPNPSKQHPVTGLTRHSTTSSRQRAITASAAPLTYKTPPNPTHSSPSARPPDARSKIEITPTPKLIPQTTLMLNHKPSLLTYTPFPAVQLGDEVVHCCCCADYYFGWIVGGCRFRCWVLRCACGCGFGARRRAEEVVCCHCGWGGRRLVKFMNKGREVL